MRARTVIVVLIVLIAAAVFALKIFTKGPLAFAGGRTVALADYHAADPTGVPTNLANADQVKRGEYLARAADCMVCHTAPGGTDYAGGLAIPLPFGTLYSTNITPDKDTGIGNYSDQDFLDALRRGNRRDGARLYPAMPYTSYTYMTDADALAIKAYLFSLPAGACDDAGQHVCISVQPALVDDVLVDAVQRRYPLRAQYRRKAREWNRGAYIAEALAHCGECHTPRNLAFALDNGKKFAGAVTAGWQRLQHHVRQGHRHRRLERRRGVRLSGDRSRAGPRHGGGPDGRSRRPEFQPDGAVRYPRAGQLCAQRSAGRLARSAGDDRAAGAGFAEGRRRDAAMRSARRSSKEACVSCHNWTGVSAITPYATIAGARAVNDRTATNVAQIVISGTVRHTPRRRHVDAGLRQHAFRHRDRGGRQLCHRAVRQCAIQHHRKGRGGAAEPDLAVI